MRSTAHRCRHQAQSRVHPDVNDCTTICALSQRSVDEAAVWRDDISRQREQDGFPARQHLRTEHRRRRRLASTMSSGWPPLADTLMTPFCCANTMVSSAPQLSFETGRRLADRDGDATVDVDLS